MDIETLSEILNLFITKPDGTKWEKHPKGNYLKIKIGNLLFDISTVTSLVARDGYYRLINAKIQSVQKDPHHVPLGNPTLLEMDNHLLKLCLEVPENKVDED